MRKKAIRQRCKCGSKQPDNVQIDEHEDRNGDCDAEPPKATADTSAQVMIGRQAP